MKALLGFEISMLEQDRFIKLRRLNTLLSMGLCQKLKRLTLQLKITKFCICFQTLDKWVKVFNSRLSKFWGRQSLTNLKGYGLLKQTI